MRENISAASGISAVGETVTAPQGTLTRVCVYCGSSLGNDPLFTRATEDLGRLLAEDGIELVYGGGNIGLMGTLARAVLDAGGRVTGIIPDFLKRRENMLDDVQELVVVPDMHTRKQLMFDRADAFVALPGGIGTLEELVEQMTWAQLGRHTKPILLLDMGGFWRPLIKLLEHMTQEGFIRPGLELTYLVAERTEDVIPTLRAAMPARPNEADDALIVERF